MAHILSAGKIMSIIPSGGKLNPRYVCSWRSYDRHWMPKGQTHGFGTHFSWWHSPCQCVLAFFLRFAMFSEFMNLQNQRHFCVFFFNCSGFSTLLHAIFSIAKDAEHLSSRLDSLIQDFGSLLKGTACKLLDGDVTTYQDHLTSYWTKMLQRIRNVLQVAGRRCYNVSGTSYKLLDEDVTTYQERLTVTGQGCYNVSGTSCKLLDKDVTTYQEIVIDNAGCRTLLHPPNPPQNPPKTNLKKTIYKSDNSLAPQGAPSPKTCHEDPWGVKSKQWMNQYLLADEAYGWKTFLANHYC